MMEALFCLIASLRSLFRNQRELALENLALRQQLAILARTHPHPRLRKTDRLFWVWLSRMWKSWRESLIVVKPDTVVRWHRKGFALYWTRLSGEGRTGATSHPRCHNLGQVIEVSEVGGLHHHYERPAA